MQQLTASGAAFSGIAKVRTFKHMTISAAGALFTVSTKAKCFTDGRIRRCRRMRVRTVRFYTVTLSKVNTIGQTLWAKVVRQITGIAMYTFAVSKELSAEGNLLGVVGIPTSRAFGT